MYILPVLSAATTWYSTKQSQSSQPSEGVAAQQQKIMLMFMPVFIGYISLSFPAGLVLYWVTSNLMQILQQWWLMRKPAQAN
jgi:YidC/Oxa1 family membrane protein insertase